MKFRQRIRIEKELEQSLVRVIGGLIVSIYMFIVYADSLTVIFNSENLLAAVPTELELSAVYTAVMLGVFLILVTRLAPAEFMRLTALIFEISIISFAMFAIASSMVPLFFLYYWVIIGHAFRFGMRDLLISTGFSFFGFGLALVTSSYWHEHLAMGVTLLMSLILIPLYIGMFAHRDQTTQTRLEQEKKHADAANREKSNFLANVSHELRTPLNGVTSVGELLMNTELTDKQREYVHVISTSSKVLLSLINNILDYSKIESGIIEIENIAFNVRELVTQVVTILNPIATEKGIIFETRIADTVPKIAHGDPTKISQILMNLGNNAIKFTDYGYTVINVFPTSDVDDTVTIRFEVIDTGIGIKDSARQLIFERFKQQDESITRRFGGTGLGTAISKKLVEHMGGSIGVSSEVGVGSRFWFELPFKYKKITKPITIEQNVIIVSQSHKHIHSLKQMVEAWDYCIDVVSDFNTLQYLIDSNAEKIPVAIIIDFALVDEGKKFIESLDSNIQYNIKFILLGPAKLGDKRTIELFDATLPVPVETRQLYHSLHVGIHKQNDTVTPIHAALKKNIIKATSKLNILICDDEATNLFVLNEILVSMGHNVTSTENGFQALDMLQNHEYDLAILDLQMPELSGDEVAEMYQYATPGHQIPLILATANVTSEVREKCDHYFKAIVDKPIDYQKLSAIITKIIAESDAQNRAIKIDLSRVMQTILFDEDELKTYPKEALAPEFLTSLFETFIQSANKHLSQIKYTIERQDIESFKNHSHALKGIAGNVKAKRLVEFTAKCQKLDRDTFTNKENMDYIYDSLNNCLRETSHILYQYLKTESRKDSS